MPEKNPSIAVAILIVLALALLPGCSLFSTHKDELIGFQVEKPLSLPAAPEPSPSLLEARRQVADLLDRLIARLAAEATGAQQGILASAASLSRLLAADLGQPEAFLPLPATIAQEPLEWAKAQRNYSKALSLNEQAFEAWRSEIQALQGTLGVRRWSLTSGMAAYYAVVGVLLGILAYVGRLAWKYKGFFLQTFAGIEAFLKLVPKDAATPLLAELSKAQDKTTKAAVDKQQGKT